MKRIKLLLIALVLIILNMTTTPVQAETRQVIFFKENTCSICAEVEGYLDGPNGPYTQDADYIYKLEQQGVDVIIYDIKLNPVIPEYAYTDGDGNQVDVTAIDVFAAFNTAYSRTVKTVPVIFAGDTYYEDFGGITQGVTDGSIYASAATPLKAVNVEEGAAYSELTGFIGFLIVLGAGILDGFNPCAIALLLLFISLLGFSEDKRVLILVSVVYIFALFVSYFLIGTLFLGVLEQFASQLQVVGMIINWVVLLLVLFLFLFNLYDYFQAKKEDYGKIKNQLPKWLQRYNKKIMKIFTGAMNSDNNKGIFAVLAITFILGITLSITELVCTGQIYFGILFGIHTIETNYAYVLLLAYNLMFVMPLIIIAVSAIKLRSIVTVSTWVREHMTTIKLGNAILFLGIFLYFLYRVIHAIV